MLLTFMMFQDAGAGGAGGGDIGSVIMQQMLFIVPIIAIFYFLLIRPQNQRMKKHREMVAAVKKGDTIVTQGGIIGKIVKVGDDEITIDAGEGVKLRFLRGMILEVRNKAEPVPANDAKEG